MAQIRSRILQYMPKELLVSLNDICYDVTIPDNNTKVDMMVSVLDKFDIDYIELGPGTNRYAILIDGYVFKIAMDRYGIKDNWAEFAIAKELQPYVTKTYECNGLVVVAEYVTVISKDEFIEKKDSIRNILSYLAQGYLMGDVGSISKNFMNWGYRDDGQLVVLDYAYIYRIKGDEMICGGLNADGEQCMEFLEYDENFNKLTCPKCRKTYTFYDIRKKIDSEYEKNEVELSKQMAYQTTEANAPIDERVVQKTEPITKEDIYGKDEEAMYYEENVNEYENKISNEDLEAMYDALLDKLPSVSACETTNENTDVEQGNDDVKIDMEEVLETAEEFVEDLNIDNCEESKSEVKSEYDMMKDSIIGGDYEKDEEDEEDDSFFEDPEEVGYISEDDVTKPATISETIREAVSEELEEEFEEIKENIESLIGDDCEESEDEVSSSITFIDEDEDLSETEEELVGEADLFNEIDSEDVRNEEDSEEEDCDNETEETTQYALEVVEPEDEIPDNDVDCEPETSEQSSFIQFIEPDNKSEDDIDAMRRSLLSDIPDDDELDEIYDQAIRDNQDYRYGKKRGRVE